LIGQKVLSEVFFWANTQGAILSSSVSKLTHLLGNLVCIAW
jgi:hypothetical protein